MGKLTWHEYARYVSITASFYGVWASFFAFFYRKFLWDFVGGILRNPGGLQPAPVSATFVALIIQYPVIQSVALAWGLSIIAFEYPVPQLKSWAIYRTHIARIVLLLFQAFLNSLYYQGTNCAIWSLIAIVCYSRAIALGKNIGERRDIERVF